MTSANLPKTDIPEQPLLDPVFLIPDDGRLVLDAESCGDTLASHLGHCITRDPMDLKSHTRLVYLALGQRDSTALYSALLDLFIALEDQALSLRRHLLKRCAGKLQPHQRDILQASMEKGLHRDTPLSDRGNSLLHRGNDSALPLVTRRKSARHSPEDDPLAEAREYLEYGQLEQALDRLESAMLRNPDNPALGDELLALYRQTGLKERHRHFIEKLMNAGLQPPASWSL
ncbi:type IV pilus assembly protein FimV [Thiolapillus sp.]